MNRWLENSKKNLLPLSKEKIDFQKALREWSFTGEIKYHEQATEICEVCEHENLKYHFEIMNDLQNHLWVGSKCIEKFDIVVFDENRKEITTKKELYLQNQARKKHILNVLFDLSFSETNDYIKNYPKSYLDKFCIRHYDTHKEFNPKILNYLFLRLDEEGIFYNKKAFKIKIKSNDSKNKLLKLSELQFDRIKKALTTNQCRYYIENKRK